MSVAMWNSHRLYWKVKCSLSDKKSDKGTIIRGTNYVLAIPKLKKGVIMYRKHTYYLYITNSTSNFVLSKSFKDDLDDSRGLR